MKIILRGAMAHIVLTQESTDVMDIIQDIMLHPPEKYSIEIHLNKNREILSLIILDCSGSPESIMRIINFFVKKYEKTDSSIALQLNHIIQELQKLKPMYPKNLFRFDLE